MPRISIVIGTRPEIIKLSPIIRLRKKNDTDIIFSGQHYDYDLGLKFINELGLRTPDFKLKISKQNPAKQIGQIIEKLSDIFLTTKPDTVVIQGDTNTVLAGAIAAIKCKVPVSHVEAGLRSFDWRMPEEHNRIVTDHLSEFLFAPTNTSKKTLLAEKVHGKIFVTGNTVIDAIKQNLVLAEKNHSSAIEDLDDFILVTLHRAENVDDKKTLGDILHALIESKEKIVFPIHPRTVKRISEFGFDRKVRDAVNIKIVKAVGYFDMILLMKKCRFILTDSGGIQEEATSPKIRKKVLVVRKTTDRPEAIKIGASELVGTKRSNILMAIKRNSLFPRYPKVHTPYGKGTASQKILKILSDFF